MASFPPSSARETRAIQGTRDRVRWVMGALGAETSAFIVALALTGALAGPAGAASLSAGTGSSHSVSVRTHVSTPAPVSKARAAKVTTSSVTLAWSNPSSSGFAGVKICRSTSRTNPIYGSCRAIARTSRSARSFADTGLRSGTHYSFELFSVNNAGRLGHGVRVNATTVSRSAAARDIVRPTPVTVVPIPTVTAPPVVLPPTPPTTVARPPVVSPPPPKRTSSSALANPSSNVTPSAAFDSACFTSPPSISACNSAALSDINRARAGEGLGPLQLPGNFYSLNTVGQVLAVANAERTSRGLPGMPQNTKLDQMAQQGAVAGTDPTGPSGYGWASNYSAGYPTALAADFGWMYDDGPGSPNSACPASGGGGCWGHRDNILSRWGGQAGAGVYDNHGMIELTELFVEDY